MAKNEEILIREVLKLSKSQVVEEAFKEWDFIDTDMRKKDILNKHGKEIQIGTDTCLCSKHPVMYIFVLENRFTKNQIVVGRECVHKFGNWNWSVEWSYKCAYKLYPEIKELYDKAGEKLKTTTDDFEKKFLISVRHSLKFNSRFYNGIDGIGRSLLSEKQMNVLNRILEPNQIKTPDVSYLDNIKTDNTWEQGFIASVKEQLLQGRTLSEKQQAIVTRIQGDNPIHNKVSIVHNFDFSKIKHIPRPYQIEAYQKWKENNYVGSAEMGTGVGKTLLGVMIHSQFPNEKMLVVTPTEALLEQWKDVFKKQMGIDAGVYYGKDKDMKQVTIAVINSVRSLPSLDFDIIVLDEGHRYLSNENIGIFNHKFNKMISLTATFNRDDGMHKELFKFCPLIYSYGQKIAVDEGYLSPYNVINVPTELTDAEEKQNYDDWSDMIKKAIKMYGSPQGIIANMRHDPFAVQVMKAISKRRQLLLDNNSKIAKAIEVLERQKFERCFIFNEYIKTATKTYELLQSKGYKVGMYHSKLGVKNKREMLEKFRTGEYNVIVTVKALDEGIDVPSSDLAIIVGRTSQKRQAIQRTGRILRKVEGVNKTGTVYNVFVKDTVDENWVKASIKGMTGASSITWEENGGTSSI